MSKTTEDPLIEAIHDLTRVSIALSGKFASKSDAVRGLSELSISPTRIARILAMRLNDVTSILARDKKKMAKESTDSGS